MNQHSEYMKQARKEIDSCLEIWRDIFKTDYSKSIKYAYAKGSATKDWDSYIDYVPVLSDVDIHIKLFDHAQFLNDDTSFHEAVNISETYESRFIETNPNYFHLPRMQILKLDDIMKIVDFIHPRESSIKVVYGKPEIPQKQIKSNDFIKQIDLKNLLLLEEFLQSLPMGMCEKTGYDLWSSARRMSWRVSPSPVRLLTQSSDDPLAFWDLNRTKIAEELEKHDYHLISESYKDFYYEGWISFMEGFTNSQSLRRLISNGFEVLKLCLEEGKKIAETTQLLE